LGLLSNPPSEKPLVVARGFPLSIGAFKQLSFVYNDFALDTKAAINSQNESFILLFSVYTGSYSLDSKRWHKLLGWSFISSYKFLPFFLIQTEIWNAESNITSD